MELVASGMVVGLGTGETATYAIRRIGALLRAGKLEDIEGVATSLATAAEAVRLGIPLLEESRATPTDITIDGADEIDPGSESDQGPGRCSPSGEDRRSDQRPGGDRGRPQQALAGAGHPGSAAGRGRALRIALPGRVSQAPHSPGTDLVPYGPAALPSAPIRGTSSSTARTGPIERPEELAAQLQARAGVVAHGLFLGLATDVIVAGPSGVEHRTRR